MLIPGASRWSPGASNLTRGRSFAACGGGSSVSAGISLILLLSAGFPAVHADTSLVALTLPEINTTSGYFPLSKALRSVMRLAVEDINGGALAATLSDAPAASLDGNLTLSVVEVATGSRAIEGLCDALEYVGDNGTFGIVGPMLSSQASLLETVSNDFFGLPMVTPSASAARANTYFSSGAYGLGGEGSYLFGVQPDVFSEMEALARLILDLKVERDLDRGWYRATERVSMIYTDDTYGTIAASAFVRAVRRTEGINIDSTAAGPMPSSIELAKSKPVNPTLGTDYRPTLSALVEDRASIVVLLSEGYDGTFIRSVLEQALEVGLANEDVQWYLSGASAMDGIFSHNESYHDSQLAYDFRGMLGVRACPAIEGSGSEALTNLTSRWAALDSDKYPGAGFGTLTPGGRLDPLLAYAYDAVFVLAAAVAAVQSTAADWGGALEGFVTGNCPFRSAGLWQDGAFIREAALGTEIIGVTGPVAFRESSSTVTSGAGTAGSGWRRTNGTEFCALNLQAHASLGATFATTMLWRPETFVDSNGTLATFEKISPYQKNQTFPAGSDVYPFDRPTLSRQHFEVITEEAAVPFAFITRRDNQTEEYTGIALDMLEVLSGRLGFTYNVSVANSSVSTDDVIGYVSNGTYDMVASSVTISERRLDTVSFSYPFMATGLSFVYRPEVLDEVNWWKMFQPFERPLWMLIIATTVVMFALLWLFDGAKNEIFTSGVPTATGSKRRLTSGIAMSSYVTGALLMGQMAHEPYTVESYILTSGWMFACFILGASFTAELASFLSAEKEEALSFGVDDLKNGAVPHTQVAVRQEVTLQAFYEEEIMGCYGEAECYGGEDQNFPVTCYTIEECFELVKNETVKVTLVDSITAAYRVADEYCGLDILSDTFNKRHFGLVLEKDSPYLGEFELALLELEEDGTLAEIADPYFDTSRCAYLEDYENASSTSQNLKLVDLAGVFLILMMFMAVSLVVWVFRKPFQAKKKEWRQSLNNAKTSGEEVGNLDPDQDLDTRTNSWPLLSPKAPASSTSSAMTMATTALSSKQQQLRLPETTTGHFERLRRRRRGQGASPSDETSAASRQLHHLRQATISEGSESQLSEEEEDEEKKEDEDPHVPLKP
ncbi:unnamed protein product [Ectocarpus sp. CCAP 1310/34]|nr:unnamed protein product [Ectocarpus sp. CCAP 1310/34]